MMIRSLMTLLVSLFLLTGGCLAKSGQAIYTGIEWANQPLCWVDDTHLVFLQQNLMNLPAEQARPKGLYLFDVTQPTRVLQLDLAPLPASIHEEIGGVLSCQDQTIVFYRTQPDSQVTEHYAMRLNSPPERIAQWRWGEVSLTGHYLLMSRPAISAESSRQGRGDGNEDCPVHAIDLPPAVRPPRQFTHADKLTGVTVRVSGAGGRYPSALCGRCVL